jgi:hypothetical protein
MYLHILLVSTGLIGKDGFDELFFVDCDGVSSLLFSPLLYERLCSYAKSEEEIGVGWDE